METGQNTSMEMNLNSAIDLAEKAISPESSITPVLAIAVSLIASVLIIASYKNQNLREFWTFAAGISKLFIVLSLLPKVLSGSVVEYTIFTFFEGISFTLKVDAMGLFFALLASLLWIITSSYSIGYMRKLKEHSQTRYFASFALCVSATIGVAFSANLMTFLIFYEMLTFCTYPLVIHKQTPEAIQAGRKYLVYTLSAGLFLLIAIIMVYQITGTLEFAAGGILTSKSASPEILKVLFLLFVLGVGVKAGIMPLHGWLPAAMVAPTPVSALLHAVAVVKSGVFGCIRIFWFVFGTETINDLNLGYIMAWVACFTVITASMIALFQDNLKRRLAFSTVSQLSYIVLGSVLLSKNAMLGGLMHIANHAFMKITLFFCAGSIYANTHKTNISQLDGIGKQMPITMGAFTVGCLGMVGLPPVAGLISKWYLCLGAIETGDLIFLWFLLVSSVLNAAYFFPIIYRAFLKQSQDKEELPKSEGSLLMLVPIAFAATGSVLLFFRPKFLMHFWDLANMVVKQIVSGG